MDTLKVVLPRESTVVLLEDSPMRIAWFQDRVQKLAVCRTVQEFKDYFIQRKGPCDFLFWDHDLGTEETGLDAAKWFLEYFGSANGNYSIIHSWNRSGARKMQDILQGSPCIPFGGFEIEYSSPKV